LLLKNFDMSPISTTLPHVKKVRLWNPIIKSVKKNESKIDGINFLPKKTGI